MNDRPFQRLDQRLAGLPVDETLHDGAPDWFIIPLRLWLDRVVGGDTAQRVALRLRWRPLDGKTFKEQVVNCPGIDLLVVLDAVLQLHPGWHAPREVDLWRDRRWTAERWMDALLELTRMLVDASSLYRIDFGEHRLVRRIDETVQESADRAIRSAPDAAADHLRTAWVAAYGLDPDPDKVFNEAIRAVEEIACPLVEQKRAAHGGATLGTVLGELKNSGHKWELVLSGKDGQPRSAESTVAMLETLWQAQLSRHGGAPKSRRQNQEEAEAAVHLAVLLVQWLSGGVLRRKPCRLSRDAEARPDK